MPFDVAAVRLVEPRQRQRRAQFETMRTLLLRDRDSGQKRFLGSRRVDRVTLQQHLAADAMQLGVELAISGLLARRKRFVEDGEGAIDVAARASASARVMLASPSEVRIFCSRKSSAPRRMSLILSTGCQWRAIAKDLPPRSTLYDYFDLWGWDGTLDRIHDALYAQCRQAASREASPTAAIIDSQSVKSAEKGGMPSMCRGYDAG